MSLTEWQTWEPFVDALRRSAPPGTDVSEFAGTVGGGAWDGSYLDDGDADARRAHYREAAREAARTGGRGPKAELDDALRAIADLSPDAGQTVRVVAGPRPADDVVELVDLPASVVSGPVTPVLEVVLEPGALPARYRETISPPPDGAAAASADPDAVTRLIAERMPDAVGAAPDEIAAAEGALPDGARLPDEVRALYAAAGSGNLSLAAEQGGFSGFEIVPLRGSFLREAFLPAARFSTWTADADTSAPADPAGRVQAAIGSPLWFPVGTDGAGNVFAADLAPGPNGHVGQVVLLDHEQHAGAAYRADSLAALLVRQGSGPGDVDPVGSGRAGSGPTADGQDLPDRSDGEGAGPGSSSDTEFLNLAPADWAGRLDAGTVPPGLKAAGFVPVRAALPGLPEAIAVANRLLELRGRELIEVTRLTRPEGDRLGAPESKESSEKMDRPRRKGLLGRLFDR
ncbi:SMI1/KNR4 family protein [Promicromonospora sp. MEB111]|uniref:SMI1/KNR4 family protein n=1 Tax=unclassified Promicromonospora TaxID=2647929 RepID=UPI00254C1EB7|nr:SMI1/KNR4 family protein [Promicromonospora sp. MEB111]